MLMGAAASCPTFDFDGANISILFYMFQIIGQKIKINYGNSCNSCSFLPFGLRRNPVCRDSSKVITAAIVAFFGNSLHLALQESLFDFKFQCHCMKFYR